jgi:hypothetical protein
VSDAFKKVRPGDKLEIQARAWNQVIDQVTTKPRFATGDPGGSSTYLEVPCENKSGNNVPRWGVLAITGVLVQPTGASGANATNSFQRQPGVIGVTPSGPVYGRFVIAVEPINNDTIGRVAIDGVVQCKVHVRDTKHKFARTKDGSVSQLESADSGDAVLLWAEPTSGTDKWGLVRIGQTQQQLRVAKYKPTGGATGGTGPAWAVHTLGEVDVYEDGTPPSETRTTGATITGVVNHAKRIPWDSWVLIEQASNSSWYVVETETKTVTGPCKMEIVGESLSIIEGYSAGEIQILGHTKATGASGCAGLYWVSITQCTGATGATG